MFRSLFVGMRDVARYGSKSGEPRTLSYLSFSLSRTLGWQRVHRSDATIHGTCSPTDQSLSYGPLGFGSMVPDAVKAYLNDLVGYTDALTWQHFLVNERECAQSDNMVT